MKKERELYQFYNISDLKETEGIRERCKVELFEQELLKMFPNEKIKVTKVKLNETGVYKGNKNLLNRIFGIGKSLKGLPPYCEVQLLHNTGDFIEKIIIWSPLTWNDRFAGTAGGGISTGGLGYLAIDNTTRGWTLPYAIINGFTAATADAGNVSGLKDFMIDPETKELRKDLYENWRVRTTHFMTVFGKAVAEILHSRPVKYSYMNGGSGGGRQSLMEAQEYPEDYDGIWASCPAINWTKFVLNALWQIAVMNTYNHVLTPNKIRYFTEKVWESVGGKEKYYSLEKKVEFDPYSLVGIKSKDGIITELDAQIMQKIWNGPSKQDGTWLWYGFRPGVVFWRIGIPVAALYYSLFRKTPKPFFLSVCYARWIKQNPKQKFSSITIPEFEKLFEESINKFYDATGDMSDLSEFVAHGGKLIIDHGLNDPLIPVDGTIDYYKRICESHGGKDMVNSFCKLYLTPGDGHGNCWCEGPGITESSGISALINWVENGKAPAEIRAVRVNKKSGELLKETMIHPVDDIEHWS